MTVSPPPPFDALILAAGVGRRLAGVHEGPKALLPFAGRSLLRRHIAALRALGAVRVVVVAGHAREALAREAARADADVRIVDNPSYREGSILSLLHGLDALAPPARPLVLMDADVLFHPGILHRLVASRAEACLLMDRGFEPGDEPVKIRVHGDRIVEFGKNPDTAAFDAEGESVGFFRVTAAVAAGLAARARAAVDAGRRGSEYEPILRDLFLSLPPGHAETADITGLPWTEIDFPEDVERAHRLLAAIDAAQDGVPEGHHA